MKCLACQSDDTYWVDTYMENEDEGYQAYSCQACKSRSEYWFRIKRIEYTGKVDVYPCEFE